MASSKFFWLKLSWNFIRVSSAIFSYIINSKRYQMWFSNKSKNWAWSLILVIFGQHRVQNGKKLAWQYYFQVKSVCIQASGKLLTHPSPNPTLTLTSHIRLNLEEGRWVASQRVPKIISSWSHVRPEFWLSTQKTQSMRLPHAIKIECNVALLKRDI